MISRRFADFLARLRKGVREEDRERLAAVLELNRALAQASDFKELGARLLDEAVQLFGAERGFLILAAGDGDFAIEVARSLDREPVRSPRQKVSATVVRQCLASGEGVFCEDAQEGDFRAAQSVADMKLRSVLCMPLIAGNRTLGCIYLDHRFQSGVFRQDDLPWFHAFAHQGAIAVHLHRLLEENRRHTAAIERHNETLQEQVRTQEATLTRLVGVDRLDLRHEYAEIRGESPALVHMLKLLDKVMDSDFPVLLVGESGTGKELLARALHTHGPRSQRGFRPVNVAAIQPSLLESELFGHVRGAFTGADRDRPGLLRDADGGVLFLDEVTEMDLDLQAKLLRFLEDSQVRPLGSDRTVTVDLRVVAATNRDPAEAIETGRFRRDLYYRLAVMTIEVPPLRERRSDIPALVRHFFAAAAAARGAAPVEPTEALLQEMVRRSWPGNLRQLRNEVLRLDALAEGAHVDVDLLSPAEPARGATPTELDLHKLESWAIQQALQASGGNKAEAARLLGISRRALYNKLQRGAG